MASGDTLIDASGNVLLDASGNEYVVGADVGDCACCAPECGEFTHSNCASDDPFDSFEVTFSGVTTCSGCVTSGSTSVMMVTQSLDDTYCLPRQGTTGTNWRLETTLPTSLTLYGTNNCTGSAVGTESRLIVAVSITSILWRVQLFIGDGYYAYIRQVARTTSDTCRGPFSGANQNNAADVCGPAPFPPVSSGGTATATGCCETGI